MQIRDIFEVPVEEPIEPVIKVSERQDTKKLASEIGSYLVTPTIERYLDDFLEHYTDTLRLSTGEVGVWISGYFGSGKSHLAKITALLLENLQLDGLAAARRFEARLKVDSPRREPILRSLSLLSQCDTQILAYNINAIKDSKSTPLPKLLLSQFYQSKGYGGNVIYARVIEAELDKQGKLPDLHRAAERLAKKTWADIQNNLSFYANYLYRAAVEVAPDVFASPEDVRQALALAEQGEIYSDRFLVQTLLEDLEVRQKVTSKPCRLVIVLDEVGRWVDDDGDRLDLLQGFIEEAASQGQGKIWVFVTTHEDMGAIYENALGLKKDMKRIEGRFRCKWSLTTENIELVIEDRLLKKKRVGRSEVIAAYGENPGILRDLGELKNTNQILPECSEERFTAFYPFLPYQIHLIPEIVKSLRTTGGRGEQLSGSTRTLLAIAQDILRIGRRSYLDVPVGEIISFDEIYGNLAGGEINPDVRGEIRRIEEVVPNATPLTRRVAEVLYLIREIAYIPRTIDNIARLLVERTTDDLATLINRVRTELNKLIQAKLVAEIGEEFEFLTGERRTFEEEVAQESADLRGQGLQQGIAEHFAKTDIIGFSTVSFKDGEFPAHVYFDDTPVSRDGFVDIRVYSPLSVISGVKPSDLEDRSLQADEKQTIFVLCDRVPDFDSHLRYYLAMQIVVNRWKQDSYKSKEARQLATEREANDLIKLRNTVKADIQKGLKYAHIVFRGTSRTLSPKVDQKPGESLRQELSSFWATLYSKYEKVPVRILNEPKAILDILKGSKTLAADVQKLKLFDKAGQLDPQCALLDAIRLYVSNRQSRKERVLGQELTAEFEKPPYGWDPNAVRVGVAALVRVGAMRVLINKKTYTNPNDEDLQNALRAVREFNRVELVLEETETEPEVVEEVRKLLMKLAGVRKIDETPAALSDEMEKFGSGLMIQANQAAGWAKPARLPLPPDFHVGKDTFETILALSNPVHRVKEIHLQQHSLGNYVEVIRRVAQFVEKWGDSFAGMKEFAATLDGIGFRLKSDSSAKAFLDSWNLASTQATFTDAQVWKDLQNSKVAAELDLERSLLTWREDARMIAQKALDQLPQDLANQNLPVDELQATLATSLSEFIANLESATGVAHVAALPEQARQQVRDLENTIIQERQKRDRVSENDRKPEDYGKPSLKYIRISDITKRRRIATKEQWQGIRDQLDAAVIQALDEQNEVELQ
jgi:hypothetical protein